MKLVDPDQVSLFRVSLPCGFAPKIGCGNLARPLLLALERIPGITEAWLNQAGTLLAVVGNKTLTAKRRARVVKAALEAEDIHDARHPRYPGLTPAEVKLNFRELIAQKD